MKRFALLIAVALTLGTVLPACTTGHTDSVPSGGEVTDTASTPSGGEATGTEATPAAVNYPVASGQIAAPAPEKKPITRDNIVINAYLVQLQNEELVLEANLQAVAALHDSR